MNSTNVMISVVGLGYVGLPLAVAFSNKYEVIGFDISADKIENYKAGMDVTNEVGSEILKNAQIEFSCDETVLKRCNFHIVAVPTPVNKDKTPDLTPVIKASEIVGRNLTKGSTVVYESTVYPGVTEDICVSILERLSGLKCGEDFKVGYSPERINPGDKTHRLESIVKIVSAMDQESLDLVATVYESIILAGVHKAESIRIAEAAKVIENSQRDINIAFMNELSMIFNKMNIDTQSVLKAASTKWNFLNFKPGLVGGHCIGVDPYYLTHKAEELGYHPQVILSGRRINDGMGKYVAEQTVKAMIKAGKHVGSSKVAILGVTFKENCPDVRNSKVFDVVEELREYGVEMLFVDPVADEKDLLKAYNCTLTDFEKVEDVDALIVAVPHEAFCNYKLHDLKKCYKINESELPLIDVKGIYSRNEAAKMNYLYWRL